MGFTATKTTLNTAKTACLVLPVLEGGKLPKPLQTLNQASKDKLNNILAKGDINGKTGSAQVLYDIAGIAAERVLLVGIGKTTHLSRQEFFKVADGIITALQKVSTQQALIAIECLSVKGESFEWLLQHFTTRYLNHCYRFTSYKSKAKPCKPKNIKFALSSAAKKSFAQAIAKGEAISAGMSLARDLGNLPGNVCTPNYLLKESRKLARNHSNIQVASLSEAEMEKLGMGAFISVSKGSSEPGKLIIIEYKGGKKSDAPHMLVGKGVTFDTGGISLKPGAGMDEMKFDMCGAASVIGTIHTISQMNLPLNVTALVAAAENMPSGNASKPGDIVTTLSGQTVEILNTDAEGRLVLCDALTYAERFKPASIVDVATLTGACVIALGNHATAIYSNDEKLGDDLRQAGEHTGDRGWPMPLWDEYQPQLNSPFADMANIGGRNAGSVTAACFLSRFTKKQRWAHLDIAGTAWISGGMKKGATGRPVPMLTEYLIRQVSPS